MKTQSTKGSTGVKKATSGPEESCARRAGPLYNVEKKGR
jgi:hypothetical protein